MDRSPDSVHSTDSGTCILNLISHIIFPMMFACSSCPKVYQSQAALRSHISDSHSHPSIRVADTVIEISRDLQNNLKCPIKSCGILRKRRRDFVTHIKTHGLNVIAPTAILEQNGNIQCFFPLNV